MNYEKEKPKVSVGMPVHNAQKFIRERVKNILEQSLNNFELIISDNASDDETEKIGNELAKTDYRIHYFRQNKNIGPVFNFQFVLMQSNADYFVWAAADDKWDSDFLKESVNMLERNIDYVGCIGQVEKYAVSNDREISVNKRIKKIVDFLRWSKYGPHEAAGSYNRKIRVYLKASSAQSLYGVFRTWYLKKSFITDSFLGVDLAIILNILRFGNFHVIEKTMIKFHAGGQSSQGIIESTKRLKHSFTGRLFPYYPLTKWLWNNLEKKIFFDNIDVIIKINVSGFLALVYDLMLRMK